MKRDPIGRSVVRYFKGVATSAWGKLSRTHDPGPAPSPAPIDLPPLTWAAWTEMHREVERPGWSFCRLGIRTPDDGVGQVFGYVRDGFGMYGKRYQVCGSINGVRQLWSLVHLRSGLGLGLFATPSEAGEAGDIAIRLGLNGSSENDIPHLDWLRLRSAWRAASFDVGRDVYAHQILNGAIVPGGLDIWQYDIMSDITSRPEKLS